MTQPPRLFDLIVCISQYKERASRLATSLGKLLVEKNKARTEALQRLTKVRAGTAVNKQLVFVSGYTLCPIRRVRIPRL